MCGIAGLWELSGSIGQDGLRASASAMAAAIRRRGPDAGGAWVDEGASLALAHRRLSILDLSEAGAQPMSSATGRHVLSFNGEIYNHLDLRKELERTGRRHGAGWRGHSDTETILSAVEAWGLRGALERFEGMFAFALWDRAERTLHLAVDRMGEKPLYYGCPGTAFYFASDLAAVQAVARGSLAVDRRAVALYLRYNCIPAPHAIYEGFRKLIPGTFLSIRSKEDADRPPQSYWSVLGAAEEGRGNPFQGSDREAVDTLESKLGRAVERQMLSDVPLGAFLSGGIDSTTIVALMQARSQRPVRTFTIGFESSDYDEAAHAKAVARHLGTDHTELYLTWKQAMDVIPSLPEVYSEPFSDSSQIPTLLVAKLAKKSVTVCLSGDGGDELFGGYNRHSWGPSLWRKVGWMPAGLRRRIAEAVLGIPPRDWDRLFSSASRLLPASLRLRTPGEKIHKFAGSMGAADPMEMYTGFVSHWREPSLLLGGQPEPPFLPGAGSPGLESRGFAEKMLLLDMMGYLPGDILVKVDRAGMYESLESRIPFLDRHVVEFALSLPMSLKIRDGQGKWPVRQLLYRHVPGELVDRPKMGFAVPLDSWLRGPLRDWAESLLETGRMREEGLFDPAPIRRIWREHLEGRGNWQHHLWDILMFQAWSSSRSGPGNTRAPGDSIAWASPLSG